MKISDLIAALGAIAAEHGNLEIDTLGCAGDRRPLLQPQIAYRLILSGVQRKPAFWSRTLDPHDKRGAKVVRL